MKISILLFIILTSTASEQANFTANWEGYSATVYLCPTGYKTVGYGQRVKYHPHLVGATKAEHYKALETELKSLTYGIDHHPKAIQLIVVDMRYQLGRSTWMEFKRARAALARQDYAEFAAEIKDSRWYKQSGRRSRHHYLSALECAK